MVEIFKQGKDEGLSGEDKEMKLKGLRRENQQDSSEVKADSQDGGWASACVSRTNIARQVSRNQEGLGISLYFRFNTVCFIPRLQSHGDHDNLYLHFMFI